MHAVVFGSDQGLVGRFNEVVVEHAMAHLESLPVKAQVWAVGECVRARLLDAGQPPVDSFPVPGSVAPITGLVAQILLKFRSLGQESVGALQGEALILFYNRPTAAGYEPVSRQLRASAESLAGENASRLAAMQRVDRNIGELLTALGARFHRICQSGIDEEPFDVIAGFDALRPGPPTLR